MRASGWIDYEERFDVVTAHVAAHLSEPLDLVRLASVAGLSPKHWHRVFTSAFGETMAAFVKRLRMQHASSLLANSSLSIATIAAECGYPNVASFTRAFAAVYGVPPARYRASGSHTAFRNARAAFDAGAFEVEIRRMTSIPCLAVRHRGSYFEIDTAFRDLEVWYAAHGYDAGTDATDRLFGMFLSDPTRTAEADLLSLACRPRPAGWIGAPVPVADGAAELVEHTIEGGSYAVLTHTGPYADMPAKYEWLFGCWVIASGVALADGPTVEQYLNLPRATGPDELVTELWLPLQDPIIEEGHP